MSNNGHAKATKRPIGATTIIATVCTKFPQPSAAQSIRIGAQCSNAGFMLQLTGNVNAMASECRVATTNTDECGGDTNSGKNNGANMVS